MAENVYAELLGQLDRALLGDNCHVWLRRHVENSSAQLSAAQAVLKRVTEATKAAQHLEVSPAVAATAEQLRALAQLQRRIQCCIQRACVTESENLHANAQEDDASATESEEEEPASRLKHEHPEPPMPTAAESDRSNGSTVDPKPSTQRTAKPEPPSELAAEPKPPMQPTAQPEPSPGSTAEPEPEIIEIESDSDTMTAQSPRDDEDPVPAPEPVSRTRKRTTTSRESAPEPIAPRPRKRLGGSMKPTPGIGLRLAGDLTKSFLRLEGITNGSTTFSHIQKVLSVGHPYAKGEITPRVQASWLRTLSKRFVGIGSFVENLPFDQRLVQPEAEIVASVFVSVVKEIIPLNGALKNLLKVPLLMSMKAREVVAMLTSFQQLHGALTCCRLDGFMMGNVGALRRLLKHRFPEVEKEWGDKCDRIIECRSNIDRSLLLLMNRRTRADHPMTSKSFLFEFDQNIHTGVSLWDLSQDLIVSQCIDLMDEYVATISVETRRKNLQLDQLAAWKTAIAKSGKKRTKKLPGSVIFPMLSSLEK